MANRKTSNQRLKISRRIVNTKRHTTGYVISGQTYSVAAARRLVEQGQISGVRVVGRHIQSEPGRRRLAELPATVQA